MKENKVINSKKYDIPLIVISFLLVSALVIGMVLAPDVANKVSSIIFSAITQTLGSPILWFVFGCFILCLYIAFSKYGNIRLGKSKPEFTTFSYIAMMICSGFGSGTVYWAFLEYSGYVITPPFGVGVNSTAAYNWASAYNFHHWGPVAWGLFCIASLPIAYSYHVKNNSSLRVSEICQEFVPQGCRKFFGKFIDYMFVLSTIAGIAIVVGLGTPVISSGISSLTGLPDGFMLAAAIIIAVAVIYTITSYIGIEKGMKKISDYGIYILLIFFAMIIILGPTQFILDQTTTGVGLLLQNIIEMSLFTDAIGKEGFPQNWTVWFWSYWLIYAPFMGVFVTRVSKGRTLREVVICMVGGGAAGVGIFMVATNAFSMHSEIMGLVPVSEMLKAGQGNQAIIEIINTLPMPGIILSAFILCTIMLLATTLDGCSFSLAANTQKDMETNEEPNKLLRVFWCVVLTLVPLALIYIKAPISTIQVCSLFFSIPIIIMMSVMIKGLFFWLRQDYGKMSSHEIYIKNQIDSDL